MRICVFIFLFFWFTDGIAQKPIKFTLHIDGVQQRDAFSLKLYKHLFDRHLPDETKAAARDAKGNYAVSTGNMTHPVYVTMVENFSGKSIPIFELYLAEPGDDIKIDVAKDTSFGMQNYSSFAFYFPQISYKNYKIVFSGKGAAKYTWRYEIGKTLVTTDGDQIAVDSNGNFIAKNYAHNYFDFVEEKAQKTLDNYKPKIDQQAWQILKTDFFSSVEIERLRKISYSFPQKDSLHLKKIMTSYERKMKKVERDFSSYAKTFSPIYAQFVLERILFRKNLKSNNPNLEGDLKQVIAYINENYRGELKDRILTFLGLKLPRIKVAENFVNDLLTTIKTDYCINELSSFADKNFVGRTAYPFSLPDSSGKIFSLEDFKGKVVFVDFWFNGCGNCVQYFKSTVSKAEAIFQNNLDVVFITINTDKDRGNWIKGLNEGIYTSSEAFNLYTGGLDHPIIKNYRAWAAPRPLLIGKDGKIFSNDHFELRGGGIVKLEQTINKALKKLSK